MTQSEIANDIYVAWDNDPELFQLTFSSQYYTNARLATLEEVKSHAADCMGFIECIKSNELVQLVEGVFRTYWETIKDPVGFEEKYLYLVDFENNEHLIY